ncbi:MAG: ClC family H(+)/Cl(-) exchange transporter [Bacillota bacterium]|nr:ClC family H(+)/Cl(-) exchange transporter [Bacillota bacterium]
MKSKSKSKVYKILSGLNTIKWRVAFKGILSGVIAGLLVVMYRLGIEYGTETAVKIYAYLRLHPLMILLWVLFIAIAGLFIAWLIKFEPMASGSGIPQVEGQLIYGLRIKWYTVLAVRFLAGILSSIFGLSLGREGPSIQIGVSGSQAFAKKISKNKIEENYLMTGGAAAGLSAAFNAPLSGIVFALEEVHRSFSGLVLIAATTAALTADVVSKYFFGLKPVLSFAVTPQLPESLYIWLLPLGIISGIIGVLMNKALLGVQTFYNNLPWFVRPCIALLIALPCGIFLPQVLGGGSNLIKLAETADRGFAILSVYLGIKFLFTCTSFGSGTPGGIFMPILSIGALSGSLVGLVAMHFGLPANYIPDFAVCGMAGALSGSVKAPVTSILLAAEMTGSLVHLLPVAACSFIALFLSGILKVTPIYEALLERIVEKNGKNIKNDKLGGVVEIAVEFGSSVSGKCIGEVEWPQGALIAGIHRGDDDIVPSGNTKINPGDYLIVLSSDCTYNDISANMRDLCYYKT